MKSKYSTGYLTPQANRVKKNINPRLSESHEDLSVAMNMNDSIFEKLMSCPVKRQLVLNLISSEKDNIKKYKKRQEQRKKECNESPLSKVQKKHMCESPTALLRRRALEQQDRQSPSSENQLDEDGSRSNSRQSSVSSGPSPIPFNKLLDGVIAYVEIKSKDQDRSNGAKALMRSMGAIVRDQFTKDVTHVIFKDGSFTTYQKAKLMKVHLVSVLWIEAVRSSNTKVSEKKFPALGTEAYDHNVSSLCSQMQKDYEEIIRDELRRSIATGTPLPSTQSFIDRRRTIMTPIPSTSKFFSQESQSSQDKEVEQIIHNGRKTYNFGEANTASSFVSKSPELTDDDSDLSPFINGSIIKRRKNVVIPITVEERVIINSIENLGDYTTPSMELTNTDSSKSLISSTIAANNNKQSNIYGSSMDLTTLDGHLIIDESVDSNTKENTVPNTSDNSIYYKKTPKLKSKKKF
ncbi:hypothetical protein NQ314_007527 [Rhamnusium bicolor]|uniref:BRCT domain-containing protein n=1 Tax=Rhamnusium bicolor TaxID=1586634 RepID=A0AAV8YMF5_9CUCU|nr:hypothetical protein NQ314_007527 [Rhamnusium bicolor]